MGRTCYWNEFLSNRLCQRYNKAASALMTTNEMLEPRVQIARSFNQHGWVATALVASHFYAL